MFNRTTNINGGTKLVPYEKEVRITEQKAPTDESIRLLNEMQEKAKENIIKTVEINTNWIQGIAMFYYFEHMENRVYYHIRFKLNMTEHNLKGYVDRIEWKQEQYKYLGLGNEGIFEMLKNKYATLIAEEIMRQINLEEK